MVEILALTLTLTLLVGMMNDSRSSKRMTQRLLRRPYLNITCDATYGST